jgi:hypothetical protein
MSSTLYSLEQALSIFRARPSVHVLCVGSSIQSPLHLGNDVLAIPLAPVGFADGANYMARYVRQVLGDEINGSLIGGILNETREANPIIAMSLRLAIDAEPRALEELAARRLEHAQRVLSWVSAGNVSAIGIAIATSSGVFVRSTPRDYTSRIVLFGGNRDQFQETVLAISDRATVDERFAFALSLYRDALAEPNPQFRIARMYNVLEALAYRVKARMESRKAVKQLLRLAPDARAEVAYGDSKYRFDAIEIAGRLRDKLFHGSPFREEHLSESVRSAFAMLTTNAGDLASIIAGYCELELNRWALGTSEGQSSKYE